MHWIILWFRALTSWSLVVTVSLTELKLIKPGLLFPTSPVFMQSLAKKKQAYKWISLFSKMLIISLNSSGGHKSPNECSDIYTVIMSVLCLEFAPLPQWQNKSGNTALKSCPKSPFCYCICSLNPECCWFGQPSHTRMRDVPSCYNSYSVMSSSTEFFTSTLAHWSVGAPSVHPLLCRAHAGGIPAARLLLEIILISPSILLLFINTKRRQTVVYLSTACEKYILARIITVCIC